MVKHVILWKLKEEFSAEEKQQIKAGIKEGLEGLAGQIPGRTETKSILTVCQVYSRRDAGFDI